MLKASFGSSKRHKATRTCAAMAFSLVLAVSSQQPLAAQIITFDPSNYSQNLLTAARTLQQINNQVRSLENQAQSLINQVKTLTSLPSSVAGQLTSTINRMNSLVAQAKGISFDVQKAQQNFERLYPRQYGAAASSSTMVQDATAR